MLMVEFFSGDWLPSHCLFPVPKFVVLRGKKVQARWNQIAKKSFQYWHYQFGRFQTFCLEQVKFSKSKKSVHTFQNVTNRKSKLKKECSTREFYHTNIFEMWALSRVILAIYGPSYDMAISPFRNSEIALLLAIKFTIYQCRNVTKTRKNGNPKSVFSQTTII